MLLGARNADLHRLMADHLAEAGPAVEAERGAAVRRISTCALGCSQPSRKGVGVARQHADPV